MLERLRRASPRIQWVVAIASFGISLLLFRIFFGNLATATIIMTSMALHELSHSLAYRRYGIKSGIVFFTFLIFSLALTYPTEEKVLKWDEQVWVTTAGVVGNCILGILFWGLSAANGLWFPSILPILQIGAWFNFLLALLNLAPITILGTTDGTKITTIIAYFPAEEQGKTAMWTLTIAELIGTGGVILLMTKGTIGIFLGYLISYSFITNLVRKRSVSKDQIPSVPGGLTTNEATKHALIYLALIVLSLAGLWVGPSLIL